jgi:hypothetical protein
MAGGLACAATALGTLAGGEADELCAAVVAAAALPKAFAFI